MGVSVVHWPAVCLWLLPLVLWACLVLVLATVMSTWTMMMMTIKMTILRMTSWMAKKMMTMTTRRRRRQMPP